MYKTYRIKVYQPKEISNEEMIKYIDNAITQHSKGGDPDSQLWNIEVKEIQKLQDKNKVIKRVNELLAVEFGYKKCEQGNNLEKTLDEYKKLIK